MGKSRRHWRRKVSETEVLKVSERELEGGGLQVRGLKGLTGRAARGETAWGRMGGGRGDRVERLVQVARARKKSMRI